MAHVRYHLASCPANITGDEGACTCTKEVAHYLYFSFWSFALFAFEILGAFLSGSIALASDALHVLLDGTESMLSAAVSRLARTHHDEATVRRVGGTISAVLLLIAAIGIMYEGYARVLSPENVEPEVMYFAAIGLMINAYLKWKHNAVHEEHRNVTHFWQDWHLVSDMLGQLAVLIGGFVMTMAHGWYWIDGVLSIGIGLLIAILVGARLLGFRLHEHSDHTHGSHRH